MVMALWNNGWPKVPPVRGSIKSLTRIHTHQSDYGEAWAWEMSLAASLSRLDSCKWLQIKLVPGNICLEPSFVPLRERGIWAYRPLDWGYLHWAFYILLMRACGKNSSLCCAPRSDFPKLRHSGKPKSLGVFSYKTPRNLRNVRHNTLMFPETKWELTCRIQQKHLNLRGHPRH